MGSERKVRLRLPGRLAAGLDDYRALYARAHGQEVELPAPIAGILQQLLNSDRAVQRHRRSRQPAPSAGGAKSNYGDASNPLTSSTMKADRLRLLAAIQPPKVTEVPSIAAICASRAPSHGSDRPRSQGMTRRLRSEPLRRGLRSPGDLSSSRVLGTRRPRVQISRWEGAGARRQVPPEARCGHNAAEGAHGPIAVTSRQGRGRLL